MKSLLDKWIIQALSLRESNIQNIIRYRLMFAKLTTLKSYQQVFT